MQLSYHGTSGGTSFNLTTSYSTVYHSSSTYKVTITSESQGSGAQTTTAWVLNDGTVLAVGVSGYNITGSQASSIFTGFMGGFVAETSAAVSIPVYTDSAYYHVVSQGNVAIGPTTVSVTNYAANSLPTTYVACDGSSTTLQQYSFSVGTITGTSFTLVTHELLQGSTTSNGTTTQYNFELQLQSITRA